MNSSEPIATNALKPLRPNLNESGKEVTKHFIRKKVWEFLDHNGFSAFPRPYGRVPNFKGCDVAAKRLLEIDAYVNCSSIEVNPDKPQEPARLLSLENNKTLYVPVPHLSDGLLKQILIPQNYNKHSFKQLVNLRGINKADKMIDLNDNIHIDILVLGSVAVSRDGYRIGKGKGYADLEYAILKEMDGVNEDTLIITNVHDCQVFDTLPKELFKEYDVPVDYILTPTEVIKVAHNLPKPTGIYWNLLSQHRVSLMPILQSLKKVHESKGRDTTLKQVDPESQGEGDSAETKPIKIHRRRYFHRKRIQQNEEHIVENGDTGGNSEHVMPHASPRKKRPWWSYKRDKLAVDFTLMVSNIEKTVRIRDLKNALNERGIKPNDITWRGYKGFCYLHYGRPNDSTETIETHQVDSVIEILETLKICPDSETNLNVKILQRTISRIETTDVTAV